VLDSLVSALLEQETLDKEEVARLFEPLHRRPIRPAWTGSPSREPSSIPPVEVPKVAANGSTPDDSQGAVVLTPPGSGGDVHGDPTVGNDDA
jgi:cell division protease FtsH